MKNEINFKNIKNLSLLFIKDKTNKINLFKNGKLNKKSIWFWVIIILIFGEMLLSQKMVDNFYRE